VLRGTMDGTTADEAIGATAAVKESAKRTRRAADCSSAR
jgi:hypothetical protein